MILKKIFEFLVKNLQVESLGFITFRVKRQDQEVHFYLQKYSHFNQVINQAFFIKQLKGFHGFLAADLVNAKNIFQRELIKRTIKDKSFIIPCQAGKLAAVIYTNGDVYPCELLSQKIGNLSDFGFNFLKLWQSKKARFIR